MPAFSSASANRLAAAHPSLQKIFNTAIANYDCTILETARELDRQQALMRQGLTKTLDSKHLVQSDGWAHAADVAPWPIPRNWGRDSAKTMAQFYHFGGYIRALADAMGVALRWGGDWNSNNRFEDQSFDDLVHFELVETQK